jgi:hypothetical protein
MRTHHGAYSTACPSVPAKLTDPLELGGRRRRWNSLAFALKPVGSSEGLFLLIIAVFLDQPYRGVGGVRQI